MLVDIRCWCLQGRGEPIEVHNDQLQPQCWVLHYVQKASPVGRLFWLSENNPLWLHRFAIPLTGGRHDRLGFVHPPLGNEPPGRLREPVEDDGPHRHQGGDTAEVPVPVPEGVRQSCYDQPTHRPRVVHRHAEVDLQTNANGIDFNLSNNIFS